MNQTFFFQSAKCSQISCASNLTRVDVNLESNSSPKSDSNELAQILAKFQWDEFVAAYKCTEKANFMSAEAFSNDINPSSLITTSQYKAEDFQYKRHVRVQQFQQQLTNNFRLTNPKFLITTRAKLQPVEESSQYDQLMFQVIQTFNSSVQFPATNDQDTKSVIVQNFQTAKIQISYLNLKFPHINHLNENNQTHNFRLNLNNKCAIQLLQCSSK